MRNPREKDGAVVGGTGEGCFEGAMVLGFFLRQALFLFFFFFSGLFLREPGFCLAVFEGTLAFGLFMPRRRLPQDGWIPVCRGVEVSS